MNNCTKFEDYISLYIDGMLEEEKTKELFEHIENCSECAQYLEQMQELTGCLSRISLDVPSQLHEKAMDAVVADIEKRTVQYKAPKRRFPVFTLMGAAAAVVVLALSGTLGNITGVANQALFSATKSVQMGASTDAVQPLEQMNGVIPTEKKSKAKTKNIEGAIVKSNIIPDGYATDTSEEEVNYEVTDDILNIPQSVLEKSFSFYFVANGGKEIPEITGTLIYDDGNDKYISMKDETTELESTLESLEKQGFTVYMSSDVRIKINSNAQNGLLVIVGS